MSANPTLKKEQGELLAIFGWSPVLEALNELCVDAMLEARRLGNTREQRRLEGINVKLLLAKVEAG